MKKNLYIVFICSLLAIGLHLYLSVRSYNVTADNVAGPSICHINNSFSCDNTISSSFSKFMGIPLSDWGIATHIIIAFLVLFLIIGWIENVSLIWSVLSVFSALSAGASLVMLGVSAFLLNLFCPFCIILYLLSFVTAACVFIGGKKYFSFSSLKKSYLFVSGIQLAWILTTVLTHLIFINTYNIKSVKETVKLNVMDWKSAPVKQVTEKALLTEGPPKESADMVLTEFADFLCSYCRKSHYILKILKASQASLRIEYFSFPLDQCEKKSASCALTRSVYCAEKQKQGWSMHGLIFEHQSEFNFTMGEEKALEKLKSLTGDLSMDWSQWSECVNSPSAIEFQNKQLKAGEDMKVEGTPAFFINGKKMHHRYFTKTFKAIQKHLKEKK